MLNAVNGNRYGSLHGLVVRADPCPSWSAHVPLRPATTGSRAPLGPHPFPPTPPHLVSSSTPGRSASSRRRTPANHDSSRGRRKKDWVAARRKREGMGMDECVGLGSASCGSLVGKLLSLGLYTLACRRRRRTLEGI